MKEKDLISVIIPVYNVEKYLDECINSVVNQTYTNIEIMLVDDGSIDDSSNICDEWKKKSECIKVIHKKNGGLSDARNVGIENAQGKYIIFVDSDDWIPRDSIEYLYNLIINYEADIVCGTILEVFDRKYIRKINIKEDIVVANNVEALEDLMYMQRITNSASGKIYKKELFDSIKYPVGKLYEDLGTTYKVFSKANKIVLSNKNVYFYFKNNQESIVNRKYSYRELDRITFAREELEFINNNYNQLREAAIYKLYYESIITIGKMPIKNKDRKMVYEFIKKYRYSVIKNSKLTLKQRIFCASSFFGILTIKIAYKIRFVINKRKYKKITKQ